jgi:hypothetical protein
MLLNQKAEFVKVTFEIELNHPKLRGKHALGEALEFLNHVEKIHEEILYFANNDILKGENNHSILDYQRFNIENLESNNVISVSFFLQIDGIFPYIAVLKTLITICEKYGENTDKLKETFEKIISFIKGFLKSKYFILRRIAEKTLLLINDKENHTIIEKIKELLKNPDFINHYDFFCHSAITFKKNVSVFEFYDKIENCVLLSNEE